MITSVSLFNLVTYIKSVFPNSRGCFYINVHAAVKNYKEHSKKLFNKFYIQGGIYMNQKNQRSYFIEGGDNVGKTTLIQYIKKELHRDNTHLYFNK